MPVENRREKDRTPLFRRILRSVVEIGAVNRLIVPAIDQLPDIDFKYRVPIVGKVGHLKIHGLGKVELTRADKCQIARELAWNHGRLRSAADRLSVESAIALGRRSDVFIDVGAYTGLFSLAVAKSSPTTEVYAYEIYPECYQILVANVVRNNLVGRVEPRLCGIAEESSVIRIPENVPLGLLPSSLSLGWEFEKGVDIPVRALDELHSGDLRATTIKIDVEGFETEVIRGGLSLIRQVRPDIICEILRSAHQTPDLQELLSSLGYDFYQFTEAGCIRKDAIVPTKHERDWLFTCRSSAALSEIGIGIPQ